MISIVRAEDLLGRADEVRRVLGLAHRLGRDHARHVDAVLGPSPRGTRGRSSRRLRDRLVGEPPARIEALAEPAEPAQVDDAAPLLVDDQQEERVGADVDDGAVHAADLS